MKIVTAAEMREIDRITTEQYGVPSLSLMENAGTAVAGFCLDQYPQAERVGVICGKGNNGGDGLVAARKLHQAGKQVQVLLLADPAELRGDAAAMLAKLPLQPLVARSVEELHQLFPELSSPPGADAPATPGYWLFSSAGLLVDAILGTGFKPPVSGLYAAAIEALNEAGVPVLAVDVPSGADADADDIPADCVWADAVVTFTAAKKLLVSGERMRAPVAVSPIGSPHEAIQSALNLHVIVPEFMRGLCRVRALSANKGNFGHVLVVGGSRGKPGAAAMAGIAALRVGAGLCTVACPRGVQALVSGFAPELMTEDLAETEPGTISLRALEYGRIDDISRGKTVLAIGPGISRNPESAEFVRTLVHRRRVPVVLDADGLNAFEGHDERLEGSGVPLILTPHPGEMARLAGVSVADVQADRVGVARKFAHDHDCLVVLKGWRTVVAEPAGRAWINPTGNPAMAKGGTGDVLTGMIAGAVAQSADDVIGAVCDAVYLHGLAGDLGRDRLGEHSLLATDMLDLLPQAFADFEDLALHSPFEWINPGLRRAAAAPARL